MKFKALATAAILCLSFMLTFVLPEPPRSHAAPTTPDVAAYSTTLEDGTEVVAAVNFKTDMIVVGFISGGNATGYTGTLGLDPEDLIYMEQAGSYGEISLLAESIRVKVTITEEGLTLRTKGNQPYVLAVEPDSLLAPWHCTSNTGTGPCDHVDSNRDWWRCFRCCLIMGCGG